MNNQSTKNIGIFYLIYLYTKMKFTFLFIVIIFIFLGFLFSNYNKYSEEYVNTISLKETGSINYDIVYFNNLVTDLIQSKTTLYILKSANEISLTMPNRAEKNYLSSFFHEDLIGNYYDIISSISFQNSLNKKIKDELNINSYNIHNNYESTLNLKKLHFYFKGKNKEEVEKIGKLYYDLSIEHYFDEINNLVTIADKINTNNIDDIISQLENMNVFLEKNFHIQKAKYQSELQQQYKIAKNLKIENGLIEKIVIEKDSSSKSTSGPTVVSNELITNTNDTLFGVIKSDYYLKGYLPIERELEALMKNDDPYAFIPKLQINKEIISSLKNQDFDKELINEIKSFNLSNLIPFKLLSNKTHRVNKYYFNLNDLTIYSFFIILGLIAASFFVILWDEYTKYKKNN